QVYNFQQVCRAESKDAAAIASAAMAQNVAKLETDFLQHAYASDHGQPSEEGILGRFIIPKLSD
ncbi:MAG: hypothetical protein EZS28_015668, partial [Streblomastix strix]